MRWIVLILSSCLLFACEDPYKDLLYRHFDDTILTSGKNNSSEWAVGLSGQVYVLSGEEKLANGNYFTGTCFGIKGVWVYPIVELLKKYPNLASETTKKAAASQLLILQKRMPGFIDYSTYRPGAHGVKD